MTGRRFISSKMQVFRAVVLREMRVRFAGRKLGYLWAVFEPLTHIAVLTLVFTLVERVSPVDESMPVFFATGIMPWLLFTRTVARTSQAAEANQALLVYPHIYPVDFMLCRIAIESATCLAALIVLGVAGWVLTGFSPERPLDMAWCWTVVTLLGGGVGMINAVMLSLMPSYEDIYKPLQRLLYFASGIFFTAAALPHAAQDMLQWNPMLHAIEWFRSAALPSYGGDFANPTALALLSLAAFMTGLMAERLRRKEFRTP